MKKKNITSPAKEPTEAMKAYLAGFIDGEGCFIIAYSKPTEERTYGAWDCRVCVYNSNLAILGQLQEYFGGFIQVRDRAKEGKNWKLAGQLTWAGSRVVPVLKAIMPYLIGKKEQAELLLSVQTTKTKYGRKARQPISSEILAFRVEAKNKMHELNAKGKVAC